MYYVAYEYICHIRCYNDRSSIVANLHNKTSDPIWYIAITCSFSLRMYALATLIIVWNWIIGNVLDIARANYIHLRMIVRVSNREISPFLHVRFLYLLRTCRLICFITDNILFQPSCNVTANWKDRQTNQKRN